MPTWRNRFAFPPATNIVINTIRSTIWYAIWFVMSAIERAGKEKEREKYTKFQQLIHTERQTQGCDFVVTPNGNVFAVVVVEGIYGGSMA